MPTRRHQQHVYPLPLAPALREALLGSLSRDAYTIVTHVTGGGSNDWRCLLQNWAASIGGHAMPGGRASVVCLDASALHSCRAMRLPPAAAVRIACLDGIDYGAKLAEMVRRITSAYRAPGEPTKRASARDYYFKRDYYTALTWAKAAIVYAATSSGFGVIYSDSDIIYHNRMKPHPGVFAMMRGNSGYVVAPPFSSVVREWYEAGFSERWTAAEGANCCDQVALAHAVEERHSTCRSDTYPNCGANGSESAHVYSWFYIPQCGVMGGRYHAIGTHYNCVGDHLVNGSQREWQKRRAMQRNGQWHASGLAGCEADG